MSSHRTEKTGGIEWRRGPFYEIIPDSASDHLTRHERDCLHDAIRRNGVRADARYSITVAVDVSE